MAKIKMTLRVPTLGKQVGDTIEVEDAETAERLERNGSALRASRKTEKD